MNGKRERLKRHEISILKYLFRANALHAGASISLPMKLRELVVPLWHRWLVEVWHQQIPGEGSRGPLYALSRSGAALIQSILAAGGEVPRKQIS